MDPLCHVRNTMIGVFSWRTIYAYNRVLFSSDWSQKWNGEIHYISPAPQLHMTLKLGLDYQYVKGFIQPFLSTLYPYSTCQLLISKIHDFNSLIRFRNIDVHPYITRNINLFESFGHDWSKPCLTWQQAITWTVDLSLSRSWRIYLSESP